MTSQNHWNIISIIIHQRPGGRRGPHFPKKSQKSWFSLKIMKTWLFTLFSEMEPPASPWTLMYYNTNDILMILGGHFCSKTIKLWKKWFLTHFHVFDAKVRKCWEFLDFSWFLHSGGRGYPQKSMKSYRNSILFDTGGPRSSFFVKITKSDFLPQKW